MRNIIKAIGFASSYIGMKTGINLRKEETKPSHESSNRSNKLKVPTIVAVILWCIVLSFLILALRNCTPHFIKSNPVKETVARDTLQFINSSDQSLVCGHFSYDDGYYPEEGINYPVYPTPVINYSLGEFFVKPKRDQDMLKRYLQMVSNMNWCAEHATDVTKVSYCFVYIGKRAIPKTVYTMKCCLFTKKGKTSHYPTKIYIAASFQ